MQHIPETENVFIILWNLNELCAFVVFQELCSILGEDSLLVEEGAIPDVSSDAALSD